MPDDRIIHRVYFQRGCAGQATSLTVSELWAENVDAVPFFQAVLTVLASGRIYDDSDVPDTYCYYTTSNPEQLKTDVAAWYATEAVPHSADQQTWLDTLMTA